jgi:hypothetical protein
MWNDYFDAGDFLKRDQDGFERAGGDIEGQLPLDLFFYGFIIESGFTENDLVAFTRTVGDQHTHSADSYDPVFWPTSPVLTVAFAWLEFHLPLLWPEIENGFQFQAR